MHSRPSQDRAESRVVYRYHKLYEPLVELIQSLEDLLPAGLQLDETVELSAESGELLITYKARPVKLILHDKDRTFVVEMLKSPEKQK